MKRWLGVAVLVVLLAPTALARASSTTPLRPMVVYLHGCNQTAADAAGGTRWREFGDAHGIVTLFPQQDPARNGARCWNWFLPEHQHRGAGEPEMIAKAVRRTIAEANVDPDRVYIAGASAGADMATVMAAAYPDLFAAVAPFAGCAYLTCGDVTGTAARAEIDAVAPGWNVPAFVVQGTADPLNNPALGETAVRQWLGTNDVGPDATSTEDHGDATALRPGQGDACIRNNHFPCAAGATGWEAYPYTVRHHADAGGCSLVDAVYVHGLSHDYPNGRPEPEYSYTDPAGPDVNALMWAFFSRHRLGAPCAVSSSG